MKRIQANGFSLVEVMVALTVGLIILAGASTMFVNAVRAYGTQDKLARTQDNGRFAMYYLLRDLRMAGHTGCLKDLSSNLKNNLNVATAFFHDAASMGMALEGIENVSTSNSWSPSATTNLPASVWQDASREPDLLAIRMVDMSAATTLTARMTSPTANPVVSNSALFVEGDIVMLADCTSADVFQLSAAPASSALPHATGGSVPPGNTAPDFAKAYDTSARVYKFVTRRYYVRLNANQIPSLYRDDNGTGATELVEGIESLQILYGVTDTPPNGPPTRYYTADMLPVGEWPNIVSVKIGILARTPSTKRGDINDNQYDVNGTVLGPFNDGFSRRVFVATVAVKNQVLQ